MSTMVVVDASVWVSWLRLSDANHHASRLWIKQYITKAGILIAPTLLPIEVAAAISRQTGQIEQARLAIQNLYALSSMRLVPVDLALVQTAVDTAIDLRLRGADATYVAVAHQFGIPLISWDREQLERASRFISTYTPSTHTF